jgi:hypothetical protein
MSFPNPPGDATGLSAHKTHTSETEAVS